MADIHMIGEAEASDEDSISLTSTVSSLNNEDGLYVIEEIVAETILEDGQTKYLVKWAGYDDDRNSWEPRENFNSDEIFDDWQARQMRISRGREAAFNVSAWEERIERLEEAAEVRRVRRERKRRRLNKHLDDLSSISADDDRRALEEVRPSLRRSSSSDYEEAPELIWTEQEKRALTKGLQNADEPTWPAIFSCLSHDSISHVLKGKTNPEIKTKVGGLRKEFVVAGREPPEWLKIRTILKTKKPKVPRTKSRGSSKGGSPARRRDSTTSVDSLLEEIKQESSKKVKRISKQYPKGLSHPEEGSDTNYALQDTISKPKDTALGLEGAIDPNPGKLEKARATNSNPKTKHKTVNTGEQTVTPNATDLPKKNVRGQPLRKNISGISRSADLSDMASRKSSSSTRASKQPIATSKQLTDEEPFPTEASGKTIPATAMPKPPQLASARTEHSGAPIKAPTTDVLRYKNSPSQNASNITPILPVNSSSRTKPTQAEATRSRPFGSPIETAPEVQSSRTIPVDNGLETMPLRPHERRLLSTTVGPPPSKPSTTGRLGSGAVRSPGEAALRSQPNRLSVLGSGPARSVSSKAKALAPVRRPTISGIEMTNRSAVVKPRSVVSTLSGKSNVDKAKKHWKMSVQNRNRKFAQSEPAPNPDNLVFMDPQTGKISKPLTDTTAAEADTSIAGISKKITLPSFQRRTSTKGPEDQIVNKPESLFINEDTVMIDHTEVDEAKAGDTNTEKDNIAAPIDLSKAMSLSADQIKRRVPTLRTNNPLASISFDDQFSPPISAPTGPKNSSFLSYDSYRPSNRAEAREIALPTLEQQTSTRLQDRPEVKDDIVTSFEQAPTSYSSSAFTFMANPNDQQKYEVSTQRDRQYVIGTLHLGPVGPEFGPDNDSTQNKSRVKFLGIDASLRYDLLQIKIPPMTVEFDFSKTCLASEYLNYFPAASSDHLGDGYIGPFLESSASVDRLADILAKTLRGCIFFSPHFTIVIFPAGSSAWASLDANLQNVPDGVLLRFMVRKPLPIETADGHPALSHLTSTNLEKFDQIVSQIKANPIANEEPNISVVFRDTFEIEYARLIVQNGPQKNKPANVFFLCFVPQGCEHYEPDPVRRIALRERTSKEHDLFINYLEANGADEIYSMQDIGSSDVVNNGAWDYFHKTIRSGTIIFHDSCIRVDQIPGLAKFLRNGAVNIWKTSLSPMDPAEKHPHLIRLFPHGGVILLTESLILYRPHEALRIIMWFRRILLPSKPRRTWKLAARPRLREWLLDLLDLYQDTQKDVFGHGKQIIADIYTEILWLLENPNEPLTYMIYACDPELPTDEAPLVTPSSLKALQNRKEWKGDTSETIEPDHHNIAQNDDLLIQWFAEWSMVHLDTYRKFHAVLGCPEDSEIGMKSITEYEKFWGHIEVLTAEECFTRHIVTSQADLEKMESERRRKLRENAPRIKQEARKARIEERKAAKVALETRMRVYRDHGASEQEAVEAGRQLLRELGSSEKEVEECAVDLDRRFDWNDFQALSYGEGVSETNGQELTQEEGEIMDATTARGPFEDGSSRTDISG